MVARAASFVLSADSFAIAGLAVSRNLLLGVTFAAAFRLADHIRFEMATFAARSRTRRALPRTAPASLRRTHGENATQAAFRADVTYAPRDGTWAVQRGTARVPQLQGPSSEVCSHADSASLAAPLTRLRRPPQTKEKTANRLTFLIQSPACDKEFAAELVVGKSLLLRSAPHVVNGQPDDTGGTIIAMGGKVGRNVR